MDGAGLRQRPLPLGRERGVHRAPVDRTRLAAHEAVTHHPVDEAGHAAAREQDGVGELAHAQAPPGLGKLDEDVEEGDRKTPLRLELTVQRADQRRLGPEEGLPGLELLVAERGSRGPGHGVTLPTGQLRGIPLLMQPLPAQRTSLRTRSSDMSQTEVRTIEGIEIPAPGDWQIDPVHTTVEFSARHLIVSKVRGRFTGVSANVNTSG